MKTLWFVFLLTALLPQLVRADTGTDLENQYGVVTDAGQNARLERVGLRVDLATHQLYPKCKRLRYKILKDEDLNACALPDGRIYITSGMMNAVTSDDQLAAVLSHEAIHVAQKHSRGQLGKLGLGALLGVAVSLATGGNTRDAISNGIQIGAGLVGGHYSRKDEYRADDGSVKMLPLEGYNPLAMAESLQMLQDKYGRGTAGVPILGWFSSHPDTKNRVDRARKLAGGSSMAVSPTATTSIPAVTIPQKDRPRVAVIVEDESSGYGGNFWGNSTSTIVVQRVMEDALRKTEVFTIPDRRHRQDTWDEQDLAKTGRMEPGTVPPSGHTDGAEYFLYVTIKSYQITNQGSINVGSRGKRVSSNIFKAEFQAMAQLTTVRESDMAFSTPISGSEIGHETEVTVDWNWSDGIDVRWAKSSPGLAVTEACRAGANYLAGCFTPKAIVPTSTTTPETTNPSIGHVEQIDFDALEKPAVFTLTITPKNAKKGDTRQIVRRITVSPAVIHNADYLVYIRNNQLWAKIDHLVVDIKKHEVRGTLFAPAWSDLDPKDLAGAEIDFYKN